MNLKQNKQTQNKTQEKIHESKQYTGTKENKFIAKKQATGTQRCNHSKYEHRGGQVYIPKNVPACSTVGQV